MVKNNIFKKDPVKLGYRTPDRFKSTMANRLPKLSVRVRSLGGHR